MTIDCIIDACELKRSQGYVCEDSKSRRVGRPERGRPAIESSHSFELSRPFHDCAAKPSRLLQPFEGLHLIA
jgi:hypothetical protein